MENTIRIAIHFWKLFIRIDLSAVSATLVKNRDKCWLGELMCRGFFFTLRFPSILSVITLLTSACAYGTMMMLYKDILIELEILPKYLPTGFLDVNNVPLTDRYKNHIRLDLICVAYAHLSGEFSFLFEISLRKRTHFLFESFFSRI